MEKSIAEKICLTLGSSLYENRDVKSSCIKWDKVMRSNSAGRHVNYLEIYEGDVLADEMQPVLRYGASLFAR